MYVIKLNNKRFGKKKFDTKHQARSYLRNRYIGRIDEGYSWAGFSIVKAN